MCIFITATYLTVFSQVSFLQISHVAEAFSPTPTRPFKASTYICLYLGGCEYWPAHGAGVRNLGAISAATTVAVTRSASFGRAGQLAEGPSAFVAPTQSAKRLQNSCGIGSRRDSHSFGGFKRCNRTDLNKFCPLLQSVFLYDVLLCACCNSLVREEGRPSSLSKTPEPLPALAITMTS